MNDWKTLEPVCTVPLALAFEVSSHAQYIRCHPTGSRAPATIATPPCAHAFPQRPPRMSDQSTGTRDPAPIASPPGGHPPRLLHDALDPCSLSHGQSCSRAHCNTPRCPLHAAVAHILVSSHGQPFPRAHFRTSRCPLRAATVHRPSGHGHSCFRTHCSISKCPTQPAIAHISVSSQGQPCSRTHFNTSRCPPQAAASHKP